MGTTLTGKNISASYLGLLKTTDNAVIGGTAKIITDGNGNDSPLYLSTSAVGIGIASPTLKLEVSGNAEIDGINIGKGNNSIATNTAIGVNALNVNSALGNLNTAIGYSAMASNSDGEQNVAIGSEALLSNTTGDQNVAIGDDSLRANTTGEMNTAVGKNTLLSNTTGSNNIAIGRLTLDSNTIGDRNVAIGNQTLGDNISGEHNIGLGYDALTNVQSGDGNIGIGYEAGNNITTGTGSIMIGSVTRSSAVTSSNEIVIGYNTTGNGSNTVTIGNSSITANHFSVELKLGSYGSGTYTGTATQRLGVDSSGNVIEIPIGGGAVDGSGATGQATFWTDSDTISGDDDFYWDNTNKRLGLGTSSPSNELHISKSQNSTTTLQVENANTGTGARANLHLQSDASRIDLYATSSTYNGVASWIDAGVINTSTSASGGLILNAQSTGIKFQTGLTERARLDSSGRLGLNTSSPSTVLHIDQPSNDRAGGLYLETQGQNYGLSAFVNSSGYGVIGSNGTFTTDILTMNLSNGDTTFAGTGTFETSTNRLLNLDYTAGGTGGYTWLSFKQGGTEQYRIIGNGSDNRFSIYNDVNDIEQVFLKQNGAVGIGTSLVSHQLQLHNPSGNGSQMNFTDSTTTTADGSGLRVGYNGTFGQMYLFENSYLRFGTNNAERMRLDSSGRLGINETSLTEKLEVDGAIVWKGALTTSKTNAGVLDRSGNDLRIRAYGATAGSGNLVFRTGGGAGSVDSERARITSGGDILFGTTAEPNGTSAYGSGFTSENSNRMLLKLATSTTGTVNLVQFFNPNGNIGKIQVSGSSTSYITSSDYRLKEDLQDFNALDIASKIKMYDFKWKADDSRSYGVMAHELEEVLPQAVSGKKDGEEMQGVDYSKLVPILLKSIQELESRVKELEKEI